MLNATGYNTNEREDTSMIYVAGIEELRMCVAWANGELEDRWLPEFGQTPTAEQILALWRKEYEEAKRS